MAENSGIEWTHHTFNPWIGCTALTPACDVCYAERQNAFRKWNPNGWGPHAPRKRTSEANWRKPLAWDRAAVEAGERHRVFCASLADVFDNHRSITSGWHGDLWHLIASTPHLDWLLLTKRPQNIAKMMPENYGAPAWGDGWPNVWLGTTVENRTEMLRRGPVLKSIPAVVHFWSCEPLLEDLGDIPRDIMPDWIIGGGESGPEYRDPGMDAFRSLRDQCDGAGVAFLFKQHSRRNQREIKANGRLLDGVQHDEYPVAA